MAMTLSQMADFICSKVGQFDATSVRLCKGYLAARYQIVYDSYFWADSQMSATVEQLENMPSFSRPVGMERIVTIKMRPDVFLDPVQETFLIESDPEVFDVPGQPKYYSEGTDVTLYPTPDTLVTLYLFGKRACPALTDDNSTSVLRNCDNAIIAFAMADMLERARQYAKAQSKFQEANELLKEAQSVEKDQSNLPRRTKNLTVAGNSLLEMTDAVCAMCGQWTPDMRILVKDFIRRNYLALYDLAIWPESTVAVRVPFNGEQVILPDYIDRVIAVRGAEKLSLYPAEISLFFNINPFIFEQTGVPISFSMLTPCGVAILPPSAPEPLYITSTDKRDIGKKVFVFGESDGREVREELTLSTNDAHPLVVNATTAYSYDVPLTISKPITKGSLTVNGATSGDSLQVLEPTEREKKHIRIWLLPIPTATGQTVLVLGKRKIKPLVSDEDTPILTNCQNVIISGAAADMFMKLGNADQAKAMQTRADAAEKVLVSLNTEQNAYLPRFIPDVEASEYSIDEYAYSK